MYNNTVNCLSKLGRRWMNKIRDKSIGGMTGEIWRTGRKTAPPLLPSNRPFRCFSIRLEIVVVLRQRPYLSLPWQTKTSRGRTVVWLKANIRDVMNCMSWLCTAGNEMCVGAAVWNMLGISNHPTALSLFSSPSRESTAGFQCLWKWLHVYHLELSVVSSWSYLLSFLFPAFPFFRSFCTFCGLLQEVVSIENTLWCR